jgi:hypothetical protein
MSCGQTRATLAASHQAAGLSQVVPRLALLLSICWAFDSAPVSGQTVAATGNCPYWIDAATGNRVASKAACACGSEGRSPNSTLIGSTCPRTL